MVSVKALVKKIKKYVNEAKHARHSDPGEMHHLKAMHTHTQVVSPDQENSLIDHVHSSQTCLHSRQVEHQAHEYWQHAYPDEHPDEIINGEAVKPHISVETQRRDAINYCLSEPEPNPLIGKGH